MFDAPFPKALDDLFKVLSGMSFGLEVASPQCAGVGSSYYVVFLMTLVALGLVMLALMAGPVIALARKPRSSGWKANLRDVVVTNQSARAFRDVFVVVLLLHPTISGKAMQFFRCRTIDGVSYLMADYSVECFDSTWYAYLIIVVLVLALFSVGTPVVIAYVLYTRRDSLYDDDGAPKPQPLDVLYAIYKPSAFYYESVQMAFKLALWSTLVFFEHGSEMQLATALVVNILQLCVHIEIKPMGGEDATLLNIMQTCTLVLTTYINFGALSMNYLVVSKSLAEFVDPDRIAGFDARISAIAVLMELLTFGLILSFGGVAIKKAVLKARQTRASGLRDRILTILGRSQSGSNPEADAAQLESADEFAGSNPMDRHVAAEKGAGPSRLGGIELASMRPSSHVASMQALRDARISQRQLSVDSAETVALPAPRAKAAPPAPSGSLPENWVVVCTDDGKLYYHNTVTDETSWAHP